MSPQRGASLALVVLILVWAYSWIVMKQVMQYAGPFEFSALRYLGGAIVLFALLVVRRESLKPTPLKLTLAVGLCQTTAYQALAQSALVSGGAGHISLLAYTMPFWAILLAWPLLSERPGRRQCIGVALAAGGLVCVMEPWQGFGNLSSALLAMGGGIGWGLGTVLSKRMFQLYSPSPLAFTAWQMLLGSLALCVIAVLVPSPPIEWSPQFMLGLFYSVTLASSLAWLIWALVVQRLPTAVASLSSLGVPVVTVLMAWLLLSERPDGMEVVGIVLIGSGLIIVSGIGRRRPRPSRRGRPVSGSVEPAARGQSGDQPQKPPS